MAVAFTPIISKPDQDLSRLIKMKLGCIESIGCVSRSNSNSKALPQLYARDINMHHCTACSNTYILYIQPLRTSPLVEPRLLTYINSAASTLSISFVSRFSLIANSFVWPWKRTTSHRPPWLEEMKARVSSCQW